MQMQLIFHPLFEYFTDFMKNIPCPKINEWMILGMCLYQGIWVLDLFTRSPAELLSCLTGTGTNSLNHGRIRDRADFSFLSRAASVGVTDTTNEFKPRFSVCSRLSYPASSSETDTGVLCERLRVSSGHWASECSSTERPRGHGPRTQLCLQMALYFSLSSRLRSSF